jgi:hypothetical protein
VLPETEVRARLMALNHDSAPFHLVDGSSEGADLVAEWKIVDAQWHEVFAKAGVSKIFRILIRFDAERHEVRAVDQELSVEWSAGAPRISVTAAKFQGQKQTVEFGRAVAFTEQRGPGEVYQYRFDTREIKGPVQDAVTACGWTYKGVAFGRL